VNEHELDRNAARRLAIIRHAREVTGNMALTCRYYGISRQVVYTWYRRYETEGLAALRDRSKRPLHSPHEAPSGVVGKIIICGRAGNQKTAIAFADFLLDKFPLPGGSDPDRQRGCRRAGRGEPVGDAVLPADLVKQHLHRPGRVAASEHRAIACQDLLRYPEPLQQPREHLTHRPRRGAGHQAHRQPIPRMVIDGGDGLQFPRRHPA